jgi:hypothetical protein
LSNFYIAGCGTVSGGPWAYTATWQHAAVPDESPFAEADRLEAVPEDASGTNFRFLPAEVVAQ